MMFSLKVQHVFRVLLSCILIFRITLFDIDCLSVAVKILVLVFTLLKSIKSLVLLLFLNGGTSCFSFLLELGLSCLVLLVLQVDIVELVLGLLSDALFLVGIHQIIVAFHNRRKSLHEVIKLFVVDNDQKVGEHLRTINSDEGVTVLVLLVDIVGEVSDSEGTGVLLGHARNLLLHEVELIHVLLDLLVLLVHLLLDGDGELVQGAFGGVLEGLPLEVADVVAVRSYKKIQGLVNEQHYRGKTYFLRQHSCACT